MRRSQWVSIAAGHLWATGASGKLHQQRQAVYRAEGKWQAAIMEAEQNRPELRLIGND